MHFHKTYIQNTMAIMVPILKISVSKSAFLIPNSVILLSSAAADGFHR